MSFSIEVVGRDKAKLKVAIRAQQCQDEAHNPHSGVPVRVADHLCAEVDRARIYEWKDKTFGLRVSASGSFHEQGSTETVEVRAVQIVE